MVSRSCKRNALLVMAMLGLGGCGTYLHDARLVGPADKADNLLTASNTLAPFDQQLTILEGFAQEEDLAVARYWAATRNAHLASQLARSDRSELNSVVNGRIEQLVAANVANDDAQLDLLASLPGERTRERNEIARYESRAADARRVYDRLKPQGDARDTSCGALRAAISKASAEELLRSQSALDNALGEMTLNCWSAHEHQQTLARIDASFDGAGGLIQSGYRSVARSEQVVGSETSLPEYAAQLQAEIDRAEQYAESGAEADLARFRDGVGQILTAAGNATRLAGWSKVSDEIDKLLRAEVCAAADGEVDAATKEAAECGEMSPTSTSGRATALWAFAEAVATLVQANSQRGRSVRWLLAAKAIVTAERAEARLQLDQSRRDLATHRRRLEALTNELAALRDSRRALAGSTLPTCAGSAFDCGFAAYSESWNVGRLPYNVLAYRTVQTTREYAVRRARSVAEKQRALALAGTATIRAYTAGGIRPEVIAQALLDLGLIGITGSN